MTHDTKATWTRLIRFVPLEKVSPPLPTLWGEPVDFNQDVGLAMSKSPPDIVKVKVWKMTCPWDAKAEMTDAIVTLKQLLSPVSPMNHADLRAVGLNYKDHAAEMKLALPDVPSIFFKSRGTIQHPGKDVVVPPIAQNDEMDYEVELAILIEKDCKNASEEEALSYVVGYTCANDLTARKVQDTSSQWSFAKSFDNFCPVGPVLVSPRALPDPSVVRLQTHLNGDKMQDGFASSMIFSIPKIIAYMSQGTTLPAGSIIITGTPSGIGNGKVPRVWLKNGDVVCCSISHGIGSLVNSIVYEKKGGGA